jgi:formate dehydrogenase major subunit
MPAARVDEAGKGTDGIDRRVDSLCPYCGVGCQLTFEVSGEKLLSVTEPQPALRQGALWLRLYPSSAAADRAVDPARGRAQAG